MIKCERLRGLEMAWTGLGQSLQHIMRHYVHTILLISSNLAKKKQSLFTFVHPGIVQHEFANEARSICVHVWLERHLAEGLPETHCTRQITSHTAAYVQRAVVTCRRRVNTAVSNNMNYGPVPFILARAHVLCMLSHCNGCNTVNRYTCAFPLL